MVLIGCQFRLFVVPDADVDARAGQHHRHLRNGRVAVVVGEEHFRTNNLGSIDELISRHSVGLVTGQEGHIDGAEFCHLGNIFRIAGNIDAETVENKDIAVVTSLGVELLTSRRGVVGGHSLQLNVIADIDAVTVADGKTIEPAVIDTSRFVDDGSRVAQRADGLKVEVILMLMRDEDDVRLGERGVIRHGQGTVGDRINLNLRAVEVYFQTGVLDARDGYVLARRRGERVGLALCVGSSNNQHHKQSCK